VRDRAKQAHAGTR